MFQQFKLTIIKPLKDKVQHACLSKSGVLLAASRRKVIISHIQGGKNEIDLLQYFKEEMNMTFKRCHGVIQISNKCDSISSCCFGVILDSTLWSLVVTIQNDEIEGKKNIEVFQLKRLSDYEPQKDLYLKFVDNCRSDMLVLSQLQPQLLQVIPDQNQTDKFTIQKYKNLQFKKEGEENIGQYANFVISNLIYQMYESYVLLYYQLKEDHQWRNHIFFFKMNIKQTNQKIQQNQEEQAATYPEHILTLPLFEDERFLTHVQIFSTEQNQSLSTSFLLAYYQLPQGLQIIETTFQKPSIIHRKFMYSDLHFIEFISSNMTLKDLQVKGTQNCLQNHSSLILSSSGIDMNHSLTMINLPSTGAPKVANQLELSLPAHCIKATQNGLWTIDPQNIQYITRTTKMQIYNNFMSTITKKIHPNLNFISKELQYLLE